MTNTATAEDREFYDILPALVPQDVDYDDPADN